VNEDELWDGLIAASREDEATLREIEATPIDPRRAAAIIDAAAARALGAMRRPARAPSGWHTARPRLYAIGGAIALAAGVALVLGTRSAPLPAYEATLLGGGESAERGPSAASERTLRVGPGTEVDLVLRPDTRVKGAVAGRAFVRIDAELRPWSAAIEVKDSGAIRVHGSFTESLGGVAEAELVLLIGRPASLPSDDAQARRALTEGSSRDLVIVRVPLAPPP
jgi:hypothetical protein